MLYGQYNVPRSDVCVNFKVGQPNNDDLPLDLIKEGMHDFIAKEMDKASLQYGDIPGYERFRSVMALFLNRRYHASRLHFKKSNSSTPDNIFITNGVSSTIPLLHLVFGNRKDTIVFVEEPTYMIAISIYKKLGLDVRTIKMKPDGLDVEEFESELFKIPVTTPVVLYTIPVCHNPTSITMSHDKKNKLAYIAKTHPNLIIIADEVYQMLTFSDDEPIPPPLIDYCSDTCNVVSMGSFSKIFAPACRLGWIETTSKIMTMLKDFPQLDSSGGVNPIMSNIIEQLIKTNKLDKHIDSVRENLKLRCKSLYNIVKTKLPEIDVNEPKGGYFLWLNTKIDSVKLLDYCDKVNIHTGNKFSAYGELRNYCRLSFSWYNNDDFVVGIDRLKCAIQMYKCEIAEKPLIIETTPIVGVHGYGKLGKLIHECGHNEYHNKVVFNRLEYSNINSYKCIIDVTSEKGCDKLLTVLLDNKSTVPLIIGSTGNLPINKIIQYSKQAFVKVVSNFSYGIPLVKQFIKHIEPSEWNITIDETHHTHKKDAPSGTAKTLAGMLSVDYKHITSHRVGEVIGEHIIKLDSTCETIEIKHTAHKRKIFAYGSLFHINKVLKGKNNPGLVII